MAIKKILLITEAQVGDHLLLTPAIRTIKENYPKAMVTLMVIDRTMAPGDNQVDNDKAIFEKTNTGILSTCEYVDETYIINYQRLSSLPFFNKMKAELSILRFLRRERFDVAIVCSPQPRFVFWALYTQASIRIGEADQQYSTLLSHTPDIKKEDAGVRDYYIALVLQFCEQTPSSNKTEYTVTSEAEAEMHTILKSYQVSPEKPMIAIHPGATGNYKIYPPSQLAEVIDYLSQSGKYTLVLCGGRMDRDVKQKILQNTKSRPIDIETKTIQQLAALFTRCILTITNDSGPRHLSVAVGTPNFAVFRKHHHKAWKVYPESIQTTTLQSSAHCPVCKKNECNDIIPTGKQYGSYCMRQISANEISLALMRQLDKLQDN